MRTNNTNWNTVSYVRQNKQRNYPQNIQRKSTQCWECGGTFTIAHLQSCLAKTTTCKICKKAGHYTSLCTANMPERRPSRTPQNNYPQNIQRKSTQCWECGGTFTIAHLQSCLAKTTTCKICKKAGHYTSLCTANMPERRPSRTPQNNPPQYYKPQQTKRVRNINQENTESDQTDESVDAEAALYIKALHEDWANINIIRPTQFTAQKNNVINKESIGEFCVETETQSHKLQWLADTGSPRSFKNQEVAEQLQKEIPNTKIESFMENTIYRCFNNNNNDIKGVLIIDIKLGSCTANRCKVLIVNNKTNHIMGRDILTKQGITLNARKNTGKNVNLISQFQTEKNYHKMGISKISTFMHKVRPFEKPHRKINL